MAVWRVNLEMDAEGLDREGFIECLLNMHYKDWNHHIAYITDTEEALEGKREELRQLRTEAELMGWDKQLTLQETQLLDEIDELEQDKLEEE